MALNFTDRDELGNFKKNIMEENLTKEEVKEILAEIRNSGYIPMTKINKELIKYLMADLNVNQPPVKNKKDIIKQSEDFFDSQFTKYRFEDLINVFLTSPRLTGGDHLYIALTQSSAANRALLELRRLEKEGKIKKK